MSIVRRVFRLRFDALGWATLAVTPFVLAGALAAWALVGCHGLYPEDQAALEQEVRLSSLAATHQAEGGIGQLLDLSNACAARGIQVRHKLAPTTTTPFEAGCPQ